jgi:uncharacterized protein YjbJ (UPF0337 family)
VNRDQIKGKGKDMLGRVQRQAGEWTGDTEQQAKGLGKQIEGKGQNALGKVKQMGQDMKNDMKNDLKRDVHHGHDEPERDRELNEERDLPRGNRRRVA